MVFNKLKSTRDSFPHFMWIITIQIVILGLIGLDSMGIHIFLLQQVVGFVYITFIPGFLILLILKLKNMDRISIILYSAGLSLASLMFMGSFLNLFYYFGMQHPLSAQNLIISVTGFVLILMLISYIRGESSQKFDLPDLKLFFSKSALLIYLIPFICIIGTYLVNYHNNNIFLIFLMFYIVLIAFLISFNVIPSNLYPLALFLISLSLLLHQSLIPLYLWGSDIQVEYYFAELVLKNGIWNYSISHPYNGVLSTNILAPTYSIFCNLDIKWVFKIIYQMIFALIPVALYKMYQNKTNSKIAFWSCFLFITVFPFYLELTAIARQEIAELFLVLLFLSFFDKNIINMKKSLLTIIFAVSIIVSHYALSYIYSSIFITSWLIIVLIENRKLNLGDKWLSINSSSFLETRNSYLKNIVNQLKIKFKEYKIPSEIYSDNIEPVSKIKPLSTSFILLFLIFTIFWYMFISSSSSFDQLLRITSQITSSITSDLLNPLSAQGLYILQSGSSSFLHSISKLMHITVQFMIMIGFVAVIFYKRILKFTRLYKVFSLLNIFVLFFCILIPFFASSINTTRLYHLSLIMLSPFFVIGSIIILNIIRHKIKLFTSKLKFINLSNLQIISIFLIIFFLFNTGTLYELAQDRPTSNSLSQEWVNSNGNPQEKINFYSGYVPEQNVYSFKWLFNHNSANTISIFTGYTNIYSLWAYTSLPYKNVVINPLLTNETQYNKGYIYLGRLEVVYGLVGEWETQYLGSVHYYNTSELSNVLHNKTNKIYSNGASNIYKGV